MAPTNDELLGFVVHAKVVTSTFEQRIRAFELGRLRALGQVPAEPGTPSEPEPDPAEQQRLAVELAEQIARWERFKAAEARRGKGNG